MVVTTSYAMSLVHPGFVFGKRPKMNEKILSDDEKEYFARKF